MNLWEVFVQFSPRPAIFFMKHKIVFPFAIIILTNEIVQVT